jgi:hypothetical protein
MTPRLAWILQPFPGRFRTGADPLPRDGQRGECVKYAHQNLDQSRARRIGLGSFALTLAIALAALLIVPGTALGQTTNTTPTAVPSATTAPAEATMATSAPTSAATSAPTTVPNPNPTLNLSTSSGLPGASVTANGSGFQAGETVDVLMNGQNVGSPTVGTGGNFSLSFTVPSFAPGQYGVTATGRGSSKTASTVFTLNQGGATLNFNPTTAAPGASLTVTGAGFRPGETVDLTFNGPSIGTATADTSGNVTWTFTIPSTLSPGQFGVTATGATSGVVVNSTYTLAAGATPVATTQPTAAPAASATASATPAATPVTNPAAAANAPAMTHDDRYFAQTGYRIDNDTIWAFFQQYGGIETFGFPTSRMMTFLGCPVQMFQRQIIQVCQGQGAALINLLDPDIFPYTQVNGSTFPAPDPTLKNNTPQVGSPTYGVDILNFVNTNVPDTFSGQPVGFLQRFNATGGLTIWGAPISQPAPDPTNANFIYQRFQRGIMHYIAGTGTESVLLADYLKAILTGQNVPADLQQQSSESRYSGQYCPGQTAWLCRPNDLPGTDLTFAFVQG